MSAQRQLARLGQRVMQVVKPVSGTLNGPADWRSLFAPEQKAHLLTPTDTGASFDLAPRCSQHSVYAYLHGEYHIVVVVIVVFSVLAVLAVFDASLTPSLPPATVARPPISSSASVSPSSSSTFSPPSSSHISGLLSNGSQKPSGTNGA